MPLGIDFSVDWKGSDESTTLEILEHVLLRRVKGNLPCVIAVTGKTGRGKSLGSLVLIQKMLARQGIDLLQALPGSADPRSLLERIVIFNPLEYAEKMKATLHNRELRDVPFIQIDEARFVVGSDQWHSFVNQTIGHVNAISREFKPLVSFIITQSLKDIDKKTRTALDFQFKFERTAGESAYILPYVFWENDNDIEKIKLCRRRLIGFIKKDGEKVKSKLKIRVKLASKELRDIYGPLVRARKIDLVNSKMEALTEKITRDFNKNNFDRINQLIEDCLKSPQEFHTYAEYSRKKWRLKEGVEEKLSLSVEQKKEFERRLRELHADGAF